MRRLFDPAYTVREYRIHLARLLGLFEPLERAVARAAGPGHPFLSLARASALREDLRIMGASPSEVDAIERCRVLQPLSAAGLPGYAYVALGSMLGGKIIVERLRGVLGPEASYHFYGDGAGRSEARWASFCSDLERSGKDDVAAICATAVWIFDAYGAWLASALVPSPGG
jgi:heme oxygenase